LQLAEKGKPLGKLLGEVITIVQPETLLKWHRRLVASKWVFSSRRTAKPGRPFVTAEIEQWVLQFARENPGWGYDRIVGALANLGHRISDQTVGNILKRHGSGPAPERNRNTSWAQFIRRQKDVLWATDFFTAEVWTATGLTTFYVLFFLHLQTRRVILGGITPFPNGELKQVARNLTVDDGPMAKARFLLHDRDAKYSQDFDAVFQSAGIEPLKLPPQSPNLNAFAERWVRSVKDECLDQLILFGERSLYHALNEYLSHFHQERNHQGLENVIPFPDQPTGRWEGTIRKSERLGGLLNFYHRAA
jgi:putative transposase